MSERTYHIVAVSLLVAGLVAGGVCWVLDGLAFYVVTGIAVAFIVAGLVVAGRAPSQKKGGDQAQ